MSEYRKKYDVFISYRREGGSETAKHLHDSLTARGYSVFLDVESLRNGPFNTALYDVIDSSKDFLLILPPNGLDRCADENDWVRLEIERALSRKKNIVPVRLKGFEFPASLPESIDNIRMLNGPSATEMEYYDAYVDRLEAFLQSRPRRKWKLYLAIALVAALGFGIYHFLTTYPLTRAQHNQVSSAISYSILNLSKVDNAGSQYLKALDRSRQYIEGKTTDSKASILYQITSYQNSIDQLANSLTSLPDSLKRDLMNSPFDVGEFEAMKPALAGVMAEYSGNLTQIKDVLISSDGLRAEHKIDYLNLLESWAELDAELLFYTFNESLLPVTNDNALKSLKNEMLPELHFIYGKRLDLTHDGTALKGKEEAVYQQYYRQLDNYQESLDREAAYTDAQSIQQELALIRALGASKGVDTGEIEARLQRLLEESEKLDELRVAYSEMSDELKESRQRLYDKYKPLEDDEAWLLWGKGVKFLTAGMPSAASESFSLCMQKNDPDYQVASVSAQRFSEVCTTLGLGGGVVVCLYEDGLPHQAVELGDIIYAVNGTPVNNVSEYSAALREGINPVSVLRFGATDYALLDAAIDSSLGRLALLGLNDEAAEAD
ncbi:MAG: TIR domain-containing protein [Clostridia bacterium]|nr:TIR domain-containing protein [Clostridia bacterium]